MTYLAVKDLKKTRELRETLRRDHELVVTKDGQPFALMVEISPDAVEDSLDEVRRALFSTAVKQARKKAVSRGFRKFERLMRTSPSLCSPVMAILKRLKKPSGLVRMTICRNLSIPPRFKR